jgi:hypothetical protein
MVGLPGAWLSHHWRGGWPMRFEQQEARLVEPAERAKMSNGIEEEI